MAAVVGAHTGRALDCRRSVGGRVSRITRNKKKKMAPDEQTEGRTQSQTDREWHTTSYIECACCSGTPSIRNAARAVRRRVPGWGTSPSGECALPSGHQDAERVPSGIGKHVQRLHLVVSAVVEPVFPQLLFSAA